MASNWGYNPKHLPLLPLSHIPLPPLLLTATSLIWMKRSRHVLNLKSGVELFNAQIGKPPPSISSCSIGPRTHFQPAHPRPRWSPPYPTFWFEPGWFFARWGNLSKVKDRSPCCHLWTGANICLAPGFLPSCGIRVQVQAVEVWPVTWPLSHL